MLEAVLAAIIIGGIAFSLGEIVVHLLAHNKRRLERRYMPAMIVFVVLVAVYVLISYIGR